MYTRKEQIASGKPVKPLTEDERLVKIQYDNGGGGSGLPEITAEDEGKVLQVVREREELAFIPEQTVTPTEGSETPSFELTNISLTPNDFTNGDMASVSITADADHLEFTAEYNSSAESLHIPAFVNAEYNAFIAYADSKWVLLIDSYDPLTISATVEVASDLSAQWEEPSGGGRPTVEVGVGTQGYELITPLETVESYVSGGYVDFVLIMNGSVAGTYVNCDIAKSASNINISKLTLGVFATDSSPQTVQLIGVRIIIGNDSSVAIMQAMSTVEATIQG